jgi:predicted TIM-barrel fold metal-dependent hydrolase
VIDCVASIRAGEAGFARLIAEMDRVGIATALVRHDVAVRHDPERGNALAVEASSGSGGRLAPLGVVAPLESDAGRVVRSAAHAGVRGFWLGSAVWRGSPSTPSAALDALLGAVARTGRPLLVPVETWGDATAIGERTAGLGIAVVLVGAHYDHIADDLAAAERFPHLVLETSRLAHFDAVRIAVARIGADRLLLGTGSPDRPPSAPVGAVVAADIPHAAKQAILGGNAARLFGLEEAPIEVPAPTDTGGAAVDVHTHLPPVPWDVGRPDAADLLDRLGRVGIGLAVASSLEGILVDIRQGNAATVEGCAADRRLRGYLVADPNDLPTTGEELARHGDREGIVGVKVHCQWSGVDAASPRMAALFELLAAHGRPVKIHVDGADWDRALRLLAERHPDLPIIVAHAGPGAPDTRAAAVAAETGNVLLELASSFAELAVVRDIVAICGPRPIVLGTDAPLLEPAWALGTYADAGLGAASHPGVFAGTAVRLLGLGSAVA